MNVILGNQMRNQSTASLSTDGHQLTHKSSPADTGTEGSQASCRCFETASSSLSCQQPLSNGQESHA